MPATLTSPARIPFHHGLFYYAMSGLMKREPNVKVKHVDGGFYDFIYKPEDDAELKEFERSASTLRSWLDTFDITFSKTFCGMTINDPNWGNVLRIMIYHPVTDDEA